MSKCTAEQAVTALEYWIGYCEKASSLYASTREKSAFELNKGSANYTYAGYYCGIQGGAWCAMQISTAIAEACGGSKTDAKAVMWGVWPYSACNQVYEAAPASSKGRRGAWTPKPGDIIVFTNDGGVTRCHTGLVYAVSGGYVYTIEGNSSNMCKKRSYVMTDSYIYGYIRPNYAASSNTASALSAIEQYGKIVLPDTGLHLLSKGCAGLEVMTLQKILSASGYKGADGKIISIDKAFGVNTQYAVKQMQKDLSIESDGYVGAETWPVMLRKLA